MTKKEPRRLFSICFSKHPLQEKKEDWGCQSKEKRILVRGVEAHKKTGPSMDAPRKTKFPADRRAKGG